MHRTPDPAGPAGSRLSRRSALAALGAGAAGVAAGPLAGLPLARAQAGEHPDFAIVAFLARMERALTARYGEVLAHPDVDAGVAEVLRRYADHHTEHADALAALAGDLPAGEPDAGALAAFAGVVDAADQLGVLAAALEAEEVAAATHLAALGELWGHGAVSATAAIAPVEAAHATVLARALRQDIERWAPAIESTDAALGLPAGSDR